MRRARRTARGLAVGPAAPVVTTTTLATTVTTAFRAERVRRALTQVARQGPARRGSNRGKEITGHIPTHAPLQPGAEHVRTRSPADTDYHAGRGRRAPKFAALVFHSVGRRKRLLPLPEIPAVWLREEKGWEELLQPSSSHFVYGCQSDGRGRDCEAVKRKGLFPGPVDPTVGSGPRSHPAGSIIVSVPSGSPDSAATPTERGLIGRAGKRGRCCKKCNNCRRWRVPDPVGGNRG